MNVKNLLNTLFYHSNVLFSLRIVISLIGSTFIPWWLGDVRAVIPLTLGVVAAALTEVDVRPLKKLQYIFVILLYFAVASFSIQILFPYPILFILGLIVSTFFFTALGIFGKRFSVISFGTLLIAAYTMLAHNIFDNLYELPCYLLLGASWYYLISFIELLLQPKRTVEFSIARCFDELAHFLHEKATLFDPDETEGFKRQLAQLTAQNNRLIAQLNETRAILFDHLMTSKQSEASQRMLNYYFWVQDMHERSHAHYVNYPILSQQLKYSDILFRFARILNRQAQECSKLSTALKYRKAYQCDTVLEDYLNSLEISLNAATLQSERRIELRNLLDNLKSSSRLLNQLNQSESDSTESYYKEREIVVDSVQSWREAWSRIKQNMTPKSQLFRHAVRMSVVFAIGYGIIQLTHFQHGYWIILTSLFVCQPNYATTKHRLVLRVFGTIGGIMIGIPLIYILPTIPAQLLLIILSGWLFFLFKNSQYAYATLFITLLVFFNFALLGESSLSVAEFRFVATLLGCGIAWLAVMYIWPDWKYRNIPLLIKRCCDDNCHYLALIGSQYQFGKTNDTRYRLIRRAVHDDNAELSSQLSIMRKEPHFNEEDQERVFRFLTLNYTLIGYFSTLSAHRESSLQPAVLALFDETALYIIQAFNTSFDEQAHTLQHARLSEMMKTLAELPEDQVSSDLLVLQQLTFILDLLPEMSEIKKYWEA